MKLVKRAFYRNTSKAQALGLLLLTTSTLAQHRPTPAKQPLAYYCASGWRVKYHCTASCRGLELCTATVKPLALGVARKRMEPCRICY